MSCHVLDSGSDLTCWEFSWLGEGGSVLAWCFMLRPGQIFCSTTFLYSGVSFHTRPSQSLDNSVSWRKDWNRWQQPKKHLRERSFGTYSEFMKFCIWGMWYSKKEYQSWYIHWFLSHLYAMYPNKLRRVISFHSKYVGLVLAIAHFWHAFQGCWSNVSLYKECTHLAYLATTEQLLEGLRQPPIYID